MRRIYFFVCIIVLCCINSAQAHPPCPVNARGVLQCDAEVKSSYKKSVSLHFDVDSREESYAARMLTKSLQERGYVINANSGDYSIKFFIDKRKYDAEAFAIIPEGNVIKIIGGDYRGLIYGALSLSEDLRNEILLDNAVARSEKPKLMLRAVKYDLPWDTYRHSEALNLHDETCRDPKYWEAFLDMMAENRLNALSLWNLHPYPFMIIPKNYPEASPFTKEEYEAFWQALTTAECAELHDFEKNDAVFEGCMPVEVMASRGIDTLRFGPMKPVGLEIPGTGELPYAVVQLRQDNGSATLYNIVGFQTHLKFPEQKRVFSMIPGLEHAEFVRYGVMHRNSYINSPELLLPTLQLRKQPNLLFAGQLTGVEGYLESAAMGLLAGVNAARLLQGEDGLTFSRRTAMGGLSQYISSGPNDHFQPMNINFGLMEPLGIKKLDNRQGAFYVMADDLLGGLYAAVSLIIIKIILVSAGII